MKFRTSSNQVFYILERNEGKQTPEGRFADLLYNKNYVLLNVLISWINSKFLPNINNSANESLHEDEQNFAGSCTIIS